jgi:hypothetical protein
MNFKKNDRYKITKNGFGNFVVLQTRVHYSILFIIPHLSVMHEQLKTFHNKIIIMMILAEGVRTLEFKLFSKA